MPFAGYDDFNDCVNKNKDKGNPKAYCATIMRKVEGTENEVPLWVIEFTIQESVRYTEKYKRERQFSPSECSEGTYRTFKRDGKTLVGCKVDGQFKVQSVLTPRSGEHELKLGDYFGRCNMCGGGMRVVEYPYAPNKLAAYCKKCKSLLKLPLFESSRELFELDEYSIILMETDRIMKRDDIVFDKPVICASTSLGEARQYGDKVLAILVDPSDWWEANATEWRHNGDINLDKQIHQWIFPDEGDEKLPVAPQGKQWIFHGTPHFTEIFKSRILKGGNNQGEAL